MAVYADILVAVNFIVDYFLLLLCGRFLHSSPRLWRRLSGSALAAVSSLTIFLPSLNPLAELLLRAVIAAAVTLATFGFGDFRRFCRAFFCFFAVSFGFAGAMLALWYVARPNGMVIHNSAVYFDVSPIFLIGFSVVGYFLASILRRLFSKNAPLATACTVTLFYKEKQLTLRAIVDSGNSVEDVFGSGEVIIVEPSVCERLFGASPKTTAQNRYRAVPCSGATGTALLEGYRCDRALIECDGKSFYLPSPIAAAAKTALGGDYEAIINPNSVG